MPVVKAVEVAAAQGSGSRPVSHKLAPVADVTLTAVQRAVKKYYRVNNLCFRCGSSEHGVAHCSHPPPGAVSESCLAASSDESAAMDSSVDGVKNDNAGTPAVLSVADGSSSRHMDLPWETCGRVWKQLRCAPSGCRQRHQALIITSQNMPGLSLVCVAGWWAGKYTGQRERGLCPIPGETCSKWVLLLTVSAAPVSETL